MHDITIPFGPAHPALPEPVHLKLFLDGEEVKGVDFAVGYNHKGIEKNLEELDFSKSIFMTGRICGICSSSHSTCFTQGIEKLLDIEIPEKAKLIRTIVFELERLHSHLLWLGMLGHEIGFDTLFMLCFREREYVLDSLEQITGKRVVHDINTIGGVRRDLTPELIKKINKNLGILKDKAEYLRTLVKKDPLIKKRTIGIGKIDKDDVERLCLVGPVARASGVSYDIRKIDKYLAYDDLDFKVILQKDGDSFARAFVRVQEIFESMRLVRQALTLIKPGPIRNKPTLTFTEKEAISRVEAPRGELIYYLRSNNTNKPARIKIRTPTYANLMCLSKILVGNNLADVPVSLASLDPCLCCTDRVTVVRNGKEEIIKLEDLHDHH
jgi:membrane-bound hydrogenase subunit alpha